MIRETFPNDLSFVHLNLPPYLSAGFKLQTRNETIKKTIYLIFYRYLKFLRTFKIVTLNFNLEPWPFRISRIQWWCSLFLFRPEILFLGKFGPKKWQLFVGRLETLFWGLIWSNNSKFSVSAEIWNIDYLEYVKFDGDCHFPCLDFFLQVLSKKSIWHFDVAWLISQQFTHRDYGFSCSKKKY